MVKTAGLNGGLTSADWLINNTMWINAKGQQVQESDSLCVRKMQTDERSEEGNGPRCSVTPAARTHVL